MFICNAIILVLSFGYVLCEYCFYLDNFEKRQKIVCDTGCCGDVHLAYCCHSYISAIILGIGGCVILLVVVAASVHILCKRCRRQDRSEMVVATRNYGAIDIVDNTETDSHQNMDHPPDEHIIREVESDVRSIPEGQRSRELKF